jgi:hypothetical protein
MCPGQADRTQLSGDMPETRLAAVDRFACFSCVKSIVQTKDQQWCILRPIRQFGTVRADLMADVPC